MGVSPDALTLCETSTRRGSMRRAIIAQRFDGNVVVLGGLTPVLDVSCWTSMEHEYLQPPYLHEHGVGLARAVLLAADCKRLISRNVAGMAFLPQAEDRPHALN